MFWFLDERVSLVVGAPTQSAKSLCQLARSEGEVGLCDQLMDNTRGNISPTMSLQGVIKDVGDGRDVEDLRQYLPRARYLLAIDALDRA